MCTWKYNIQTGVRVFRPLELSVRGFLTDFEEENSMVQLISKLISTLNLCHNSNLVRETNVKESASSN